MDYLEPCQYSTRLIEKLESLDTENILDFDLVNKAIYSAKKYHGDQKRKSDEPYYSHPLEVAYMISEHNLKTDVIVASILHDIVDDTEVTVGMIFDNFGQIIAEMVDRLNAYQKQDNEVLLIKLIDRLHNMQTIGVKTPEKKEKICRETINEMLVVCFYLNNKYLAEKLHDLGLTLLNQFTQQEFSYLKNNNIYPQFLVA